MLLINVYSTLPLSDKEKIHGFLANAILITSKNLNPDAHTYHTLRTLRIVKKKKKKSHKSYI